jgi:hypothetical protein
MKRISGFLTTSAVVAGSLNSAFGADTETTKDASCVAVAMRMSALDAREREAGTVLAIYFFGRLDGRLSQTEIERLILGESRKMTDEVFRAEAVRCGKVLAGKGQEIARIGAAVASDGAK